ncbi:hypothetical protein GCM10023219_27350 [Stakelama sediminis]|uniref:PilZ domain-containing protein n=1 Tax=Stakelama sediminis TaxID=463200 RepID=A0A840YY57_9SPHN|nr:PilZ domain-containing protein [Stakelama sediminis]MBB5718583.1 hypothetical protein [Stakelama sediminis]
MIETAKPVRLAAEFEPADPKDRRRSRRAPVSFDARLGRGGLDRALCRVTDISMHGCRVQTYSPMQRNSQIWLTLPGHAPIVATVRWANDFEAGCEFETALDEAYFDQLAERE